MSRDINHHNHDLLVSCGANIVGGRTLLALALAYEDDDPDTFREILFDTVGRHWGLRLGRIMVEICDICHDDIIKRYSIEVW